MSSKSALSFRPADEFAKVPVQRVKSDPNLPTRTSGDTATKSSPSKVRRSAKSSPPKTTLGDLAILAKQILLASGDRAVDAALPVVQFKCIIPPGGWPSVSLLLSISG